MMSLDEVMQTTDAALEKIEQAKPKFNSAQNSLYSQSNDSTYSYPQPPEASSSMSWIPAEALGTSLNTNATKWKPNYSARPSSASRATRRDAPRQSTEDLTASNTNLNRQALFVNSRGGPPGEADYGERKYELLNKKFKTLDEHMKNMEKEQKASQDRINELHQQQQKLIESSKNDKKMISILKEQSSFFKNRLDLLMNSEEIRDKLQSQYTYGASNGQRTNDNVSTASLAAGGIDANHLDELIVSKIQSNFINTIEDIISKHEKLQTQRQISLSNSTLSQQQKENQKYLLDQITAIEKEVLKQKNDIASIKSKNQYLDTSMNEMKATYSLKENEVLEQHKKQLKNYRFEFNSLITTIEDQLKEKMTQENNLIQNYQKEFQENYENSLSKFGEIFGNFDSRLTETEKDIVGIHNSFNLLKTNSIEIHEKLMETQDNVSFLSTQFDDVSKIRDDIRDLQSSRSNLITELSGITLELRQNNEIIRTNRENVELLQKELVSFDQNKEKSITELRVFLHEQLSHSNKAVEILRASQKKLKGKLIEILTNVTQLNDMKVTVKKLIEELENKMMEEISHTYEYDTSIQKHSNMINYLNEKVINLTTLLQNSTESREKVEESLSSSIQSTAQEYQEKLNALVKDFQLKLQQFTESNHHDKEIIADFMNEYKSFQNDFAKFKKDQEDYQNIWTSMIMKDVQSQLSNKFTHFEESFLQRQQDQKNEITLSEEHYRTKFHNLENQFATILDTISAFSDTFVTVDKRIEDLETDLSEKIGTLTTQEEKKKKESRKDKRKSPKKAASSSSSSSDSSEESESGEDDRRHRRHHKKGGKKHLSSEDEDSSEGDDHRHRRKKKGSRHYDEPNEKKHRRRDEDDDEEDGREHHDRRREKDEQVIRRDQNRRQQQEQGKGNKNNDNSNKNKNSYQQRSYEEDQSRHQKYQVSPPSQQENLLNSSIHSKQSLSSDRKQRKERQQLQFNDSDVSSFASQPEGKNKKSRQDPQKNQEIPGQKAGIAAISEDNYSREKIGLSGDSLESEEDLGDDDEEPASQHQTSYIDPPPSRSPQRGFVGAQGTDSYDEQGTEGPEEEEDDDIDGRHGDPHHEDDGTDSLEEYIDGVLHADDVENERNLQEKDLLFDQALKERYYTSESSTSPPLPSQSYERQQLPPRHRSQQSHPYADTRDVKDELLSNGEGGDEIRSNANDKEADETSSNSNYPSLSEDSSYYQHYSQRHQQQLQDHPSRQFKKQQGHSTPQQNKLSNHHHHHQHQPQLVSAPPPVPPSPPVPAYPFYPSYPPMSATSLLSNDRTVDYSFPPMPYDTSYIAYPSTVNNSGSYPQAYPSTSSYNYPAPLSSASVSSSTSELAKFHTMMDKIQSDIMALDLHLIKQQTSSPSSSNLNPMRSIPSAVPLISTASPLVSSINEPLPYPVLSSLPQSEQQQLHNLSFHSDVDEKGCQTDDLPTEKKEEKGKEPSKSSKGVDPVKTPIEKKSKPLAAALEEQQPMKIPSISPPSSGEDGYDSDSSSVPSPVLGKKKTSAVSSSGTTAPVSLEDIATLSMKDLNDSLEYYDDDREPVLSPEPTPIAPPAAYRGNQKLPLDDDEDDSASDVDSLDEIYFHTNEELNGMKQTAALERSERETRKDFDVLGEFENLLNRSRKSPSVVSSSPSPLAHRSGPPMNQLKGNTPSPSTNAYQTHRDEAKNKKIADFQPTEGRGPRRTDQEYSHFDDRDLDDEDNNEDEDTQIADEDDDDLEELQPRSNYFLEDDEEEEEEDNDFYMPTTSTGGRYTQSKGSHRDEDDGLGDDDDDEDLDISDYLQSERDFPSRIYSNHPELLEEHQKKIQSLQEKKRKHRLKFIASLKD